MKEKLSKLLFLSIIVLSLLGYFNSPTALLLGFFYTLIFQNPFQESSKKAIHYLLKISVVGLGFGMYIQETIATSKDGFNLTLISILLTVVAGLILIKVLKLDLKLGYLITTGTAICGGSAIAAISPVIKADSKTISISLGIVFLLNSVALFIFPSIGHFFALTEQQFGLWCAVAIHDTSSVVGAAMTYGEEALRIATTVKLSRTLWIIPLSIFSMFYFKTKGEKIKIPYFIGLFILAIIVNSYHILPLEAASIIVLSAKRLLILTLFLVGSTLSVKEIKSTGLKPFAFASILWIIISVFSMVYIVLLS